MFCAAILKDKGCATIIASPSPDRENADCRREEQATGDFRVPDCVRMNQGIAILALRQLRALPNQLTLLRLSIVPFLVLAIMDRHYHRAFIWMVIAGISDGLDGTLARIFRQRTELGSYLDPIADKLLLSTLFMVLTHVGLVSLRITVMVFSRDLGIVIIAALLYATTGTRDFHPSWLGKADTVAQILAVSSVVLAQTDPAYWVLWTRHGSLEATLWLTVFSGFHYLWRSGRRLGSPVETEAGVRG